MLKQRDAIQKKKKCDAKLNFAFLHFPFYNPPYILLLLPIHGNQISTVQSWLCSRSSSSPEQELEQELEHLYFFRFPVTFYTLSCYPSLGIYYLGILPWAGIKAVSYMNWRKSQSG